MAKYARTAWFKGTQRELGRRCAVVRDLIGIKQAEAARRMGALSPTTLCKMERGHRLAGPHWVANLAGIYGVPCDVLMTGDLGGLDDADLALALLNAAPDVFRP